MAIEILELLGCHDLAQKAGCLLVGQRRLAFDAVEALFPTRANDTVEIARASPKSFENVKETKKLALSFNQVIL